MKHYDSKIVDDYRPLTVEAIENVCDMCINTTHVEDICKHIKEHSNRYADREFTMRDLALYIMQKALVSDTFRRT